MVAGCREPDPGFFSPTAARKIRRAFQFFVENPQNAPEPEINPNEEFQKQLLEDLEKDEALEAGQDEIEEAYHANFALGDNEPEIE